MGACASLVACPCRRLALRDGWRCRRGRRARCGRGGGAAAGAATGPSPCALRSDVHTVRCFARKSTCQLLVYLGSFLTLFSTVAVPTLCL